MKIIPNTLAIIVLFVWTTKATAQDDSSTYHIDMVSSIETFSQGETFLAQVGKPALTGWVMGKISDQSGWYGLALISKDLNQYISPAKRNIPGDWSQIKIGKKMKNKQWMFDSDITIFFPFTSDYGRVNGTHISVFPGIMIRHGSVGLWSHYIINMNGRGNAPMFRLDYTRSGKQGKLELLLAYNGGVFETDVGINCGIQMTTQSIISSSSTSLQLKGYWYQNIWIGGKADNPFTNNAIAGGIILSL